MSPVATLWPIPIPVLLQVMWLTSAQQHHIPWSEYLTETGSCSSLTSPRPDFSCFSPSYSIPAYACRGTLSRILPSTRNSVYTNLSTTSSTSLHWARSSRPHSGPKFLLCWAPSPSSSPASYAPSQDRLPLVLILSQFVMDFHGLHAQHQPTRDWH